jgi:hypothetical protein
LRLTVTAFDVSGSLNGDAENSGLQGCYSTSLDKFPTFRRIAVLGLLYPEDGGIANL